MSEHDRLGIGYMVRLAARSRVALAAVLLALGLAIAEIVSPFIRDNVTKEAPFATSLVSGLLLLVLTVTVVEGYLSAQEQRQRDREREDAERAWTASADRVRDDIAAAVAGTDLIAMEVGTTLLTTPTSQQDLEAIRGPVDAAAQRVTEALNSWLPVLLQRKDLTEVAQRAETVADRLSTLSWAIRYRRAEAVDLSQAVGAELGDTTRWFVKIGLRASEARFTEAKRAFDERRKADDAS